jgi:hypothetical protein
LGDWTTLGISRRVVVDEYPRRTAGYGYQAFLF